MYTFFAYLILLLHITTRSLADSTTIDEICDYLDQNVDYTAVIAVTLNAQAQDQSIKCEQRFSVTISTQAQAENYLIFEVEAYSQDPDFYTVLLTDTEEAPEIWYNDSQKIINETYDVNAYVYRKSYQHITYSPSQLAVGKTIYFNVYNLPIQDGTTLVTSTYSISARSTPTYPCPQNCGGYGTCNEKLKQCVCNRGYFDEDCTVLATEITESQAGYDISSGDNQFFFYEITNTADDLNSLQLYYVKTAGYLNIVYSINQYNDFYLPNYDGKAYSNQIDDDAEDDYFNIFQHSLSYGSFVLLEVINTDTSNTVTFQVQVNEFYDPPTNRVTMMVIFIGVFCFLVFAWGVLTLFKFKIHRQVETLLQARNPNGQEQRDLLSKEDIDKFFKKKKYRETQCSFPQNTCSICLEDFHGESVCRQLYCEHVYHATCIESWLSQHTSCPNCKKEMTKSAIEEYLASPKLLDDKAEEEMENDGNNGLRMGLPRTLAPLEEEKDDHAPRSLHDIILQHKDGKIAKKQSVSESLTGAPLERSLRAGTPKYLEPRAGFTNNRKIEMFRKNTQDPMDFEERDVREKSEMNNSIGLRMDQRKTRNISEINPLNRRSIGDRNPDDDE